MIRSMTGFGDAAAQAEGAHYSVEIRSVNNRYFKSQIRLPDELQGLEAEIDAAVVKRLSRGSIIVTVRFADMSADAAAHINVKAIQRYLEQLLSVKGLDHGSARVDIGALMNLPGVIMNDAGEQKLRSARKVLIGLVDQACDKVEQMRAREGQTLHRDLLKHCKLIEAHLEVVKTRVPVTVRMYQERLRQRMQALLAEFGGAVRDEDLVREVAVHAERTDIAEEVARLEGHMEQFIEILNAEGGEPAGRTLDFLSQELLREANTIASKCLDVEISRRIVEIKGAIDRIKEQAQNVE
jgi:uncharacterized protein (TIGR00255 family)